MSVSRRVFLGGSVATAIACASAPLAALSGGGRILPRDTSLPNRNNVSGGDISSVAAKKPETPEQRYGGMANLSRDSFCFGDWLRVQTQQHVRKERAVLAYAAFGNRPYCACGNESRIHGGTASCSRAASAKHGCIQPGMVWQPDSKRSTGNIFR